MKSKAQTHRVSERAGTPSPSAECEEGGHPDPRPHASLSPRMAVALQRFHLWPRSLLLSLCVWPETQEACQARCALCTGLPSVREGFQADRMELAFRFHSTESKSSRVYKSQPPPPLLSVCVWFPPHTHPAPSFTILFSWQQKSPLPSFLPPPFLALRALECTASQLEVRAETVGCGSAGQALMGPAGD